MRSIGVLAVVSTLTAYASALPWDKWGHWGPGNWGPKNHCLTNETATQLVNDFIQLSNGDDFNVALATSILTEDVVDTSGSVASIINGGADGPVPLLGPTIANRSDFIAQNSAQASTPYEPLNIYWTCDVITFRFVINFTPQPVLGITILETVPAPDQNPPFKIKQIYGELNSLAFSVDLGIITPNPPPPPPADGARKRSLGLRF